MKGSLVPFHSEKNQWVKLFATPVACVLSCIWLCNPMARSLQAPRSMDFSKQEYWSLLPFPTPGDLPHQGIKPASLVSCVGRQVLYHCATWETPYKSKWTVKISSHPHRLTSVVFKSSCSFLFLSLCMKNKTVLWKGKNKKKEDMFNWDSPTKWRLKQL